MAKQAQRQQQEEDVIDAQGMLDNAPSKGRAAYLRIPDDLAKKVRLFSPEKNRVYKLAFLAWKAGRFNTSKGPSGWTTNRYLSVHQRIGPDEKWHLCVQKAFGKPCVVCEEFQRLRQAGADWDTVLKDLKPKDRELFLVHDTEDKDPANVQIWDESVHLFGDAFRNKLRRKPQYLTFASFGDKGCVVEIDAQEKKIGSSSCVDCSQGVEIDFRKEALPEKVVALAKAVCPDDWVVETPYAVLKKLLGSTGGRAASNGEAVADEIEPGKEPEEPEAEVRGEGDEEPVVEEIGEGSMVTFRDEVCEVVSLEDDGKLVIKKPDGKKVKVKAEAVELAPDKPEEPEEVLEEEEEEVIEEEEVEEEPAPKRRKK